MYAGRFSLSLNPSTYVGSWEDLFIFHGSSLYKYRSKRLQKKRKAKDKDNVVWVLDSGESNHCINTKESLTNIRVWKDPNSFTKDVVGYYDLGEFQLNRVIYTRDRSFNSLSLLRLAEEGFETYLTNKDATITEDGKVILTVPKVGSLWISNSLHEQRGWLKDGCPYERAAMLSFANKYGDEFTREEIEDAFGQLTHNCELDGPVMLPKGLNISRF